MDCPNCGTRNEPEARFCYNCGAALAAVADTSLPTGDDEQAGGPSSAAPARGYWGEGSPPSGQSPTNRGTEPAAPGTGGGWSAAPPTTGSRGQGDRGIPPQWDMAPDPYGQPPEPKRRRSRWLVIPLALIGVCLLGCIGLFVFGLTPAGEDFFQDLGTQVAERATEEALTAE